MERKTHYSYRSKYHLKSLIRAPLCCLCQHSSHLLFLHQLLHVVKSCCNIGWLRSASRSPALVKVSAAQDTLTHTLYKYTLISPDCLI